MTHVANLDGLDQYLDNCSLTEAELYDINGGIAITIGAVTVVLTLKAISLGVGIVGAIVGGSYTVGYLVGKGLAYIK